MIKELWDAVQRQDAKRLNELSERMTSAEREKVAQDAADLAEFLHACNSDWLRVMKFPAHNEE